MRQEYTCFHPKVDTAATCEAVHVNRSGVPASHSYFTVTSIFGKERMNAETNAEKLRRNTVRINKAVKGNSKIPRFIAM